MFRLAAILENVLRYLAKYLKIRYFAEWTFYKVPTLKLRLSHPLKLYWKVAHCRDFSDGTV